MSEVNLQDVIREFRRMILEWRTDILDGCPKAEGMQMLIRSMSPVVVAVDELGKEEDFKAVEAVIHCGCRLSPLLTVILWKKRCLSLFFRSCGKRGFFKDIFFLENMTVREL